MAKRASDTAKLLGPVAQVSARIDDGALEIAWLAGSGDLSLGLREMIRYGMQHLLSTGRMPPSMLARLEATQPGVTAQYHTDHPARAAAPFNFQPAPAGKRRTWRADTPTARSRRNLAPRDFMSPPKDDPRFAGWDD